MQVKCLVDKHSKQHSFDSDLLQLNELVQAERYITEALKLAAKFPELYDTGVYQANHGMLLMKQGLLDQARQVCTAAWRSAKRAHSPEGIEQADHCLKELNKLKLG